MHKFLESVMRHSLPVIALAAALGGCATVPHEIAGDNFAAVTPEQAVSQNAAGQRVRWGGEIINVEPRADATCFEVLSRELYSDARPSNHHDHSDGRFVACSKGFFDPEVYAKGRDLTVTGSLNGTEQHKVGEYNYTFPQVSADQVYLWPERNYYPGGYYGWGPYYDPFWGPYWGGAWGGWWGPPVVIVHGHHH
jgi:outer membrane lipoprotein